MYIYIYAFIYIYIYIYIFIVSNILYRYIHSLVETIATFVRIYSPASFLAGSTIPDPYGADSFGPLTMGPQ